MGGAETDISTGRHESTTAPDEASRNNHTRGSDDQDTGHTLSDLDDMVPLAGKN